MTEIARLTVAEADVLADCEETISHGLQTFVEVGTALSLIRDNRLYRAEHPTFEAYCQQRWNISRPRAYELMTAAKVVSGIPDTLPKPSNAGQANELARVPESERAEVWRTANEATDGKPTAAAIRAAANPEPPAATGEADARLATAEEPVSEAPTAPTVGAGETATGCDFGPVETTEAAWPGVVDPVAPVEGTGATGSSKPNRRPLPDAYRDAAWDLVKVAEKLDRLTTDDRFPRNAKQVARMSRGDLLRAVDLLATVVDRLHTSMKESTE